MRRLPSVEAPRRELALCLDLGRRGSPPPIHATTVGQRPNEEGGEEGERTTDRGVTDLSQRMDGDGRAPEELGLRISPENSVSNMSINNFTSSLISLTLNSRYLCPCRDTLVSSSRILEFLNLHNCY